MGRPNYRQREAVRRRLAARGEPCHICGRPIDYTLTTWVDPSDGRMKRHPLSFEYDHVQALANGGHPTAMDNAAPAHRICNQRKGNRSAVGGTPPQRAENPTSRAW